MPGEHDKLKVGPSRTSGSVKIPLEVPYAGGRRDRDACGQVAAPSSRRCT